MIWPEIPPGLPRMGNRLSRAMCRRLMGLFGWKVEGRFPDHGRLLITGAPHTSNWDWVIGILTIHGLGLRLSWLGKHTLFRKPYGWFFSALGGIPVNRKAAHGVVPQILAQYEAHPDLIIAIAPEGTRKAVGSFRSGYHRIARGAGATLVPAAFDYPNKRVFIGDPFPLTDDLEGDTARLQEWYSQFRGRR